MESKLKEEQRETCKEEQRKQGIKEESKKRKTELSKESKGECKQASEEGRKVYFTIKNNISQLKIIFHN